jgi:hypothetical protein
MPDPETLEIDCVHCGKAVRVRLSDFPTTVHGEIGDEPHPTSWTQAWECPHCHEENVSDFGGKMAQILEDE